MTGTGYTFSPKYGIIGTLLNECPGDAVNIPGRDMTIAGSHVRLLYFISSRLANGQEDFLMGKIAKQGELFPESSKYHSAYALRQRHAEIADSVVKNGNGRQVNDLTGQRFGNLFVIGMTEETHNGEIVYLCQCDCDMIIKATRTHLKGGKRALTHCGCMGVDKDKKILRGALGIDGAISRKYAAYGRRRTEAGVINSLYASYRIAATGRGLSFDLSKEQFAALTKRHCHYCGTEPVQEFKRPHDTEPYLYNGVDRLSSGEGYHNDNCVPCCGTCNTAKMDMSVEDFRDWIGRVYAHFGVNILPE